MGTKGAASGGARPPKVFWEGHWPVQPLSPTQTPGEQCSRAKPVSAHTRLLACRAVQQLLRGASCAWGGPWSATRQSALAAPSPHCARTLSDSRAPCRLRSRWESSAAAVHTGPLWRPPSSMLLPWLAISLHTWPRSEPRCSCAVEPDRQPAGQGRPSVGLLAGAQTRCLSRSARSGSRPVVEMEPRAFPGTGPRTPRSSVVRLQDAALWLPRLGPACCH